MNERDGLVVINSDTAFEGKIRNCKRLEIFGFVQGEVSTGELIVHHGGDFHGQAKAGTAQVSGTLQGDVVVDGLMRIHPSGVVAGNVHYGRLAMEPGANLSADVRNVPPRLMGDHHISVVRGRMTRITTEDITAVDPDNKAADLEFSVSNEVHGMVSAAGKQAGRFTQSDLIGGRVAFRHDGSASDRASFDVAVTDPSGGSSGAPQTVTVTVTAA
ncbi:MAG: polymer-forming cytoskeletal protein [Hyphomicrobiaceae bacterium]